MRVIRSGSIHVFTFKTGVLSRVAHDLRFSLRRFEIEASGTDVRGRFWPDSLDVEGVMSAGALDAQALSTSDREDITRTLRTKVLHTERFAVAEFRAHVRVENDADRMLDGELELHGRTLPLAIRLDENRGVARGQVELQPSRWGIEPYKALLGAIKLQDRVLVRFELPV